MTKAPAPELTADEYSRRLGALTSEHETALIAHSELALAVETGERPASELKVSRDAMADFTDRIAGLNAAWEAAKRRAAAAEEAEKLRLRGEDAVALLAHIAGRDEDAARLQEALHLAASLQRSIAAHNSAIKQLSGRHGPRDHPALSNLDFLLGGRGLERSWIAAVMWSAGLRDLESSSIDAANLDPDGLRQAVADASESIVGNLAAIIPELEPDRSED